MSSHRAPDQTAEVEIGNRDIGAVEAPVLPERRPVPSGRHPHASTTLFDDWLARTLRRMEVLG